MKPERLEAAKTVLLAALVACSLFLTWQVWWGTPGQYEPLEPAVRWRVARETGSDWVRLVRPAMITLSAGESYWVFLPGDPGFDVLFDELVSALRGAEAGEGWEGFPEEYARFQADFAHPLPLELFSGNPEHAETRVQSLLLINAQANAGYVTDSGYSAWLKIKNPPELELIPGGVSGTPLSSSDESLWLTVIPHLTRGAMSAAAAGIAPDLLAAFFLDPSVVRSIEEMDGALIYTDGVRGLRVYSDGTLEFSDPSSLPERGSYSLLSALLEADTFIASTVGWPDHPYLVDYTRVSWGEGKTGYRLVFSWSPKGLAIDQPVIEVTVGNRGVVSAKRIGTGPGQAGSSLPMIPPVFPFDLPARTVRVEDVRHILPAYAFSERGGYRSYRPVWVITLIDGMKFLINAHTGTLFENR
ncbi:MAG: hypothetical protein AB1497_01155 [Bacillota bacterium]